MKAILVFSTFIVLTIQSFGQKVYDPCQKLDTNKIKQLILGTWVDMKDTSHVLIFTEDSLTERIYVVDGAIRKLNLSYWGYKFTDNIFGSDEIPCWSLYEYKEGYAHHVDFPVNAIDANYMLLGSTGKFVYKRKN